MNEFAIRDENQASDIAYWAALDITKGLRAVPAGKELALEVVLGHCVRTSKQQKLAEYVHEMLCRFLPEITSSEIVVIRWGDTHLFRYYIRGVVTS